MRQSQLLILSSHRVVRVVRLRFPRSWICLYASFISSSPQSAHTPGKSQKGARGRRANKPVVKMEWSRKKDGEMEQELESEHFYPWDQSKAVQPGHCKHIFIYLGPKSMNVCSCVCVYSSGDHCSPSNFAADCLTADYVPLVLSSLSTAQSPLSDWQWMQNSRQSLVFNMLLLKFCSQPFSPGGVCSHIFPPG